jgi:type IV pilus assembly protein PilF
MRAAISFEASGEGNKPYMFLFAHNSPYRGIFAFRGAFAFVVLLACLPVHSWADSDSQKSKQEVEFGIEVARRGLWKEAIYRWEKAVELDQGNSSARNNLAVAYEQEGEFELAEQEYKRALELDPDSIHIRQNYELFREAYEKRKRKERRANR